FPPVSADLQGGQPVYRPEGPTSEEEEIVFGEGSGVIPAEPPAAPAPATPSAPAGFKDPTDPNSPTYFRADFGFKYTDKAGKEVNVPLNTVPGIALAMAEKGDVEALKRLQAREAAKRKAAADKAKGGATGGAAPAPAGKAAPSAPAVEEFEVEVDPATGKLRRKPKGG
ncbi:hypothetical protein K0U83_23780, partial [bacterium]|nr:hypothetical protein [bacterium]